MTKPQPARRESDNEQALGPAEVRALRGSVSRADFAKKVGVTPLTVYRWELPEDAAQSRRPRGAVAERLRRVIAEAERASRPGPRPAQSIGPLQTAPSAASPHGYPPITSADGSHAIQRPLEHAHHATSELAPEDAAAVLPAIDRLLRAQFNRAEDDLMQLLVSSRLTSNAGRSMAQAALALGQMLSRNDGRAGFVTLQPALREADSGVLPPSVEIVVRTAASLVFSSADGRLYDMGRVNAQVARATPLVTGDTSPDLIFLLHIGAAVGTLLGGFAGREAGRAARMALLDRMDAVTEPVTRLIADEMRAHFMIFGGQTAQATPRLTEIVARAAELGLPVVESRALAFLALRYTDEVGDPERILELATRGREVAARARVARGLHSVFGPKTMAEAYMRMGRFADAERALEEGIANAKAMSWSPVPLVMPLVRLYRYMGASERIVALAEDFKSSTQGTLHAMGNLLLAAEEVAAGRKTDALHLAEQHFEQTEPNPFLMEDLFVWGVSSRLAHDDIAETKLAIRRLQRLLDRFPSVVMGATVKRCAAVLACREGRFAEALPMLEAAVATSVLAHDVTEAAISRHWLAKVERELERSGSEALIAESEKECAALGLHPFPRDVELGAFDPNAPASTAAFSTRVAPRSEGLIVAVDRLSVRGTSAVMLRRELVAVTSELFPGRLVALDEIGPRGEARRIETRDDTSVPRVMRPEPTAGGELGFEFGDGLGSRLRLAVGGTLPEGADDVLRLLTTVTSLSLEVSALRGFSDDQAPAHEPEAELPGLVAASAAMRRLRAEIARLGESRATVIVQGESGTGKEIIARAIHDLSARAKGPYVTFNCAAVPRELFEGQLFGYRRGAFTGAVADHPGVIRAASGGTLFLDEIGELPLEVQPKLLRFLENREVMPLGESRAIEVDVRTIAATHQDLARRVHEGKFREDLYYRLQVVPLLIPPLRERAEDVVALARHFVRRMTPEGIEPPVLAPDALARLVAHPWPGNVRELRNVIERSLAFTPLPRALTAAHLRIGPSTIRPPT